MKSYLSLIPISAKVHRRQNCMTLLCIIFSVFMVTAVFSMAEMGARMEQERLLEKHGSLPVQNLFNSAMGQSLLLIAAVLFLLVLIAGALMISSSMNSSVAQRTQFFGMMRCIGMSKQQIYRFIRLKALNWCKTAVPIGLLLGTFASWVLCAVLRFIVGEEFSHIPLFRFSIVGLISGIVVGVVTVLLAAGSPAKRAANVSPVTAASGHWENARTGAQAVRCAVDFRFLKIETALGIHHGVSAKKNLFLMTGSFALTIILFLSFSVLINFVNYVMPQSASTSDVDISSSDGSNSIPGGLVRTISGMKGVKYVYGRQSCLGVPAEVMGDTTVYGAVDIISFDDFDLDCLKKDRALTRGSSLSKVYGNSGHVLAAWDQNSPLRIGDRILVAGSELEIAGLLKYDPFSSDGLTNGKITLITSRDTFTRLTDVEDYSLIMIQTTGDATDEDIKALGRAAGGGYVFNDKRDERTTGTYFAFVSCVYGFLGIITLVTLLNIVNSISMSVSARIKQYGAMRAVGMDRRQITRMIAAEAFTYAFWGCAAGCAVGVPCSKLLFDQLIASHFSYAVWRFPVVNLAVILVFVLLAAAIAAYAPAKRIGDLSVTETINEL